MGYDGLVKHWFDTSRFVPPVGQGAIAIEIHENLSVDKQHRIKELTNHALTEKMIRTERAFLRTMDGGCSIPVFGIAHLEQDGQLELVGGIASLDGKALIQRTMYGSDPENLGEALAKEILLSGGKSILRDIRSALSNQ